MGLATDWGRMLPCFALLQGNASETGEHLRGVWSSSFQLIPVSHPLLLARKREGWAWCALEGMLGGSLQTVGFHLISFCRSPQALGERHRPLSPLRCISDHPHPAICKAAANMVTDPASAVLLALQSQAEARLPWEKRLPLIKDGSTSPVPWRPSHGEHP